MISNTTLYLPHPGELEIQEKVTSELTVYRIHVIIKLMVEQSRKLFPLFLGISGEVADVLFTIPYFCKSCNNHK